MTFRIDSIRVRSETGGWLLQADFKGFRGRGIYAVAELHSGTRTLVITSTMDHREHVTVPVEQPATLEESALWSWFAQMLEGLGWGPQLDQRNRPIHAAPSRSV